MSQEVWGGPGIPLFLTSSRASPGSWGPRREPPEPGRRQREPGSRRQPARGAGGEFGFYSQGSREPGSGCDILKGTFGNSLWLPWGQGQQQGDQAGGRCRWILPATEVGVGVSGRGCIRHLGAKRIENTCQSVEWRYP